MIKGITFGAFDLVHAGHVSLFKECSENCDKLIVGLHVDPNNERKDKNVPIQSIFERYVQLKSNRYIDEIIPYEHEDEIIRILIYTNPQIRFLGDDYEYKDFTGKEYCVDKEIILHYVSRDHGYSTSELRKRIETTHYR